ncbi:hypothetical protein V8E52_003040 [Russula decolorans]
MYLSGLGLRQVADVYTTLFLLLALESQDDLSIDDEPPSWSDNDDGLELMSELDEEEKEGVEDDLDDDGFDLGETATINCLVIESSRARIIQ